MYIYFLDATASASYDEHEAWIVVADSEADAWALVLSQDHVLPVVRTWEVGRGQIESKPRRTVSLGDGVEVEQLGVAHEQTSRVVFAAFLRG